MEETYIRYGVPSNWADQYKRMGISASTFKNTSKSSLITNYKIPEDQVEFVKNCLERKPIDSKIIQELLENSAYTCCLCHGVKSDAYIIHHIIEYSISKDNSYDNLAVVCPNDHDLAHRKGVSLTSKITEEQIRESKKNWAFNVEEYIGTDVIKANHVTEHLIKKKIVHPVTENDIVKGYELVHDFLSKKFFEKLSPEAKKVRTTIELFRIAFKDWKQHGVLAS